MDDDLSLTDLRAFVTSARTGSISQAATILAVSQPTVSQRVQRLERAVGHSLLVRSKRGVSPTGAGDRMLGYAERMLAMQREALLGLPTTPARAVAGRRVVGLLEDLAVATLPATLADFGAVHPDVELDVRTGPAAELRRLAARGQLDVSVGDPTVMPESCLRWRQQLRLNWAASPRLDITQDPLPVVLFSSPCRWRRPLLDVLDRSARNWRVAFQSNSIAAVHAAVIQGLGITALLPGTVPAECDARQADAWLPAPPVVDVALSRRPGGEGDVAVDALERLLISALARAYGAVR